MCNSAPQNGDDSETAAKSLPLLTKEPTVKRKRCFWSAFRKHEKYKENQDQKPIRASLPLWRRLLRPFRQNKRSQSCQELQSHYDSTEVSMPSSSNIITEVPVLSLEDSPSVKTSPRALEAMENTTCMIAESAEKNCQETTLAVVQTPHVSATSTPPSNHGLKQSSRQTTYLRTEESIEDTMDLAMWQWQRSLAIGRDPKAEQKKAKKKQQASMKEKKKTACHDDRCTQTLSQVSSEVTNQICMSATESVATKECMSKGPVEPEDSLSSTWTQTTTVITSKPIEEPQSPKAAPAKEVSFDVKVSCCNIGDFSVVKEQATEDAQSLLRSAQLPPDVEAPGLWIKALTVRPTSVDSVDQLCKECHKWCRVSF